MRGQTPKRRLLLTVSLLVALLLFSNVLLAEPTTIRICNSGSTTFTVARLSSAGYWLDRNDYQMQAWFEVEPPWFFSSCESFDVRGFGGRYYFAFRVKGENGTGFIFPRGNRPFEGGFINAGWMHTERKFCVNPKDINDLTGTLSEFEDLPNCPSGFVLVPFPIVLPAAGGTYKLTIDPDGLDVFVPQVSSQFEAGELSWQAGNYDAARKYYLKAAEQGHVLAQYNLGLMYSYGQGGSQDYAEAWKWYLKAAVQGHASAQNNFGRLSYAGLGGSQNDLSAYAWFHLAATQGNESGKKNRAMVRAKLDPISLAAAENLAEEFYELYVQPFQ